MQYDQNTVKFNQNMSDPRDIECSDQNTIRIGHIWLISLFRYLSTDQDTENQSALVRSRRYQEFWSEHSKNLSELAGINCPCNTNWTV